MDLNLMDKLRLLNIDTELRPQIKMKPMHRYYFITGTNPGEQFFVFASTAAWLIRKTGKVFDQPNEEDDPNTIIAGILESLRDNGVAVDFPAHKLKQGFGEQVCFILNTLANEALVKEKFEWSKPVLDGIMNDTEESAEDLDNVEDETEITLEKLEEDMSIYSEDSEGEKHEKEDDHVDSKKAHDWEAWKLELERVTPALRLKITADARDWRARHAQMVTYKDELLDRFKKTESQLGKLHTNISTSLEKVGARENILNEQLADLVHEYGTLLEELNKVTNEYNEANNAVTERQEMLNDLTAKVESVKQRTESRGSSMNDSSPLVTAKKAVATLKKDIQDLDFQIIILMWLLITRENPNSNNLLGNIDNGLAAEAY